LVLKFGEIGDAPCPEAGPSGLKASPEAACLSPAKGRAGARRRYVLLYPLLPPHFPLFLGVRGRGPKPSLFPKCWHGGCQHGREKEGLNKTNDEIA
jgi:hypothetical protein